MISVPIKTLYEAERVYVLEMLAYCEGNRTHAAKLLDISVRTLRNKLHDYRRDGVFVMECINGRHKKLKLKSMEECEN